MVFVALSIDFDHKMRQRDSTCTRNIDLPAYCTCSVLNKLSKLLSSSTTIYIIQNNIIFHKDITQILIVVLS
jgi:hypothetical protein